MTLFLLAAGSPIDAMFGPLAVAGIVLAGVMIFLFLKLFGLLP